MTKTKEIFKIYPLNHNYEVSNLGRVRRTGSPTCLKYNQTMTGYIKVDLYRGGFRQAMRIHRLVLQTFEPTTNDDLVVNHKNGQKMDNRLENLEWVTRSENALHAYRNGLMIPFTKKITVFDSNGLFYRQFKSLKETAEHLGISSSYASVICKKGKSYKGYKLFYA